MEMVCAGESTAMLHSSQEIGEFLDASPEPSHFELNQQLVSWLSALFVASPL